MNPEAGNEDDLPSPRRGRRVFGIRAGAFETALLAELRLGLPPLFYYRLMEKQDDWAFVLKVHSLFEGALTRLLREKLGLRPHVRESLSPRDSFTSRVHLASRLDVMEPDYRSFLLGLNRLRNDITHNIRFLNFDFRRYVDSLSDMDFRRTAVALAAGFKNNSLSDADAIAAAQAPLMLVLTSKSLGGNLPPIIPNDTRERDFRTVRELYWHFVPKFSIWNSGLWTLDLISLHYHFECTGDTVVADPDIEAKLQDLLHDPAVIEYNRKHAHIWPYDGAP